MSLNVMQKFINIDHRGFYKVCAQDSTFDAYII